MTTNVHRYRSFRIMSQLKLFVCRVEYPKHYYGDRQLLDLNPIPAWWNSLRGEIWSRYFGFQGSLLSTNNFDWQVNMTK